MFYIIFSPYYRFHSQTGKLVKSNENIWKDVYPTRLLAQNERLRQRNVKNSMTSKSLDALVTAHCICNLCKSAIRNEEIYEHFQQQHRKFRETVQFHEKIWTPCFKCRPFVPIRGNF